jgi:hypothetical protein
MGQLHTNTTIESTEAHAMSRNGDARHPRVELSLFLVHVVAKLMKGALQWSILHQSLAALATLYSNQDRAR